MTNISVFKKMLKQKPNEMQVRAVKRLFSDKKRLLDFAKLTPRKEDEVKHGAR